MRYVLIKNKIDIYNQNDPYLILLVEYLNEYKSVKSDSHLKCYRCGARGHVARDCEDKCPYCLLNHKNKPCIRDLINVTQNILEIKNRYDQVLRTYRKKRNFKINPENVVEVLEEMIKEESMINKAYKEKLENDNKLFEQNNRKKKFSNIEDLILADVQRHEYNNIIREISKYSKEMCERAKNKIREEYKNMEKKKIEEIRKILKEKYEIMDRYKKKMEEAKDSVQRQGEYRMMKLKINQLNTKNKEVIREIQKVKSLGVEKLKKVESGKATILFTDKNEIADLMNQASVLKKDCIRYKHAWEYYIGKMKYIKDDEFFYEEIFDPVIRKKKIFKDIGDMQEYVEGRIKLYKELYAKKKNEIKLLDYKINHYSEWKSKEVKEEDQSFCLIN